jgi:hypothetical protein
MFIEEKEKEKKKKKTRPIITIEMERFETIGKLTLFS